MIMIKLQFGFNEDERTEMNRFSLINLVLVSLMLLFLMISKCSS